MGTLLAASPCSTAQRPPLLPQPASHPHLRPQKVTATRTRAGIRKTTTLSPARCPGGLPGHRTVKNHPKPTRDAWGAAPPPRSGAAPSWATPEGGRGGRGRARSTLVLKRPCLPALFFTLSLPIILNQQGCIQLLALENSDGASQGPGEGAERAAGPAARGERACAERAGVLPRPSRGHRGTQALRGFPQILTGSSWKPSSSYL